MLTDVSKGPGSRARDLATGRSPALRGPRLRQPRGDAPEVRARSDPLNYWGALTDATSVKDSKLRFGALISEREHARYHAAARCLADDLHALILHLPYPLRHRERWRRTDLLDQLIRMRRMGPVETDGHGGPLGNVVDRPAPTNFQQSQETPRSGSVHRQRGSSAAAGVNVILEKSRGSLTGEPS
jgi:hypothetical protein